MLAGTASASSAAMALATLDQVSERMPPSEHDAGGAGHDHGCHQALRLPEQPGRGIGGKARLGRQQKEDGHGQNAAATMRTVRLSKRRPRNVGSV